MTADNLTFALEIDFIPDLQEGRDDFKKKMKSVAEKIDGSYTLDQKSRPIISGLTKSADGTRTACLRHVAILHTHLFRHNRSSHACCRHV